MKIGYRRGSENDILYWKDNNLSYSNIWTLILNDKFSDLHKKMIMTQVITSILLESEIILVRLSTKFW